MKYRRFTSPFGDGFGFAMKLFEECPDSLFYLEEMNLLSPQAVTKRRREFWLGRVAAHVAMAQVNHDGAPILRGVHNEPIWPAGIVGSISHCRDAAVAAVGFREKCNGIGIDIEEIHRRISLDISKTVCTGLEIEWVREKEREKLSRLLMLFSAKESAFKAFFPIEKVFLEFHDVQLAWDDNRHKFTGCLLKTAGTCYPKGYLFEIGCQTDESYVFTYLTLPPIL